MSIAVAAGKEAGDQTTKASRERRKKRWREGRSGAERMVERGWLKGRENPGIFTAVGGNALKAKHGTYVREKGGRVGGRRGRKDVLQGAWFL
jgi:hypothetical protein